MEVFNLDIIPGKSAPVIHASQFDAGREFKANLFEGPTVYTLSGAETLSVIVRKPDGNMVTAAVTNTSDSYITFETTEQMTACDGANLCELRIENGADVIGSINFIMEVEKSPDTGITSASEIHNLEAQVDAFTAIAVADQYDSANVIFDNAPTPGHGNGYAVTSEGVKNAIPANSDFSLSGLSDTTITSPSANQILQYSSNKWQNKPFTLANLTDTTISSPSKGQILSYDGSKWKNGGAVDVKNDITWNETTASGTGAYRVANMMFITYQGESITHSTGDTLFVLPTALRPIQNWEQSFTVDGKTYGQVHVLANGNVNVNNIADNTQAGRIYFSVAFPIA